MPKETSAYQQFSHRDPRVLVIVISAFSAIAMLYIGAYQVRAIEHLKCPLFGAGCDIVADAPFARPGGIPDGFIAAALYAIIILLALPPPSVAFARWLLRIAAFFVFAVSLLGLRDMAGLHAWCFYCVATTLFSPVLVWLTFRNEMR